MSSESRPSNFEINYGNYKFTFINKFNTVQDIQLVFLISTNLIDTTKIKELIFARSRSECGFWRLCIAKPGNINGNFYLEKGPHYTMSSFIIIELQLYLDSVLDDLPIDESPQEDKRFCQANYRELYGSIIDKSRMIDNDDRLIFDNLTIGDENILDINSIFFIGDYNYEGKHNNFYQIDSRDNKANLKKMLFDRERDAEKKTALGEELKTIWPSSESEPGNVGIDININYGITNISLHGKIYSIEFKDYKLYYMIYNCKIVVPEDINKYQDDDTNYEYHAESLDAEQLIIPIYIIPKTAPDNSDKFTMYGLYNYYCNSFYKFKQLKTSKFLDYIHQCRPAKKTYIPGIIDLPIGPEPRGIPKPTCTTDYKFMGYYFDAIPFFSMIKSKTLEKNGEIIGGKQKYIKQKYIKQQKKSNKNKNKKTKKINKNKKTKKINKNKKTKKINKNKKK